MVPSWFPCEVGFQYSGLGSIDPTKDASRALVLGLCLRGQAVEVPGSRHVLFRVIGIQGFLVSRTYRT